jgi:hypothetical protein
LRLSSQYFRRHLLFHFLVKEGLRPDHVFLDIACGSPRAGRLLIPYLDPDNYLGIDKHAVLIEAGKTKEIESDVLEAKHPELWFPTAFHSRTSPNSLIFASRNRCFRTFASARSTCASGGCRLLLSLIVGFIPLFLKHRFRFCNWLVPPAIAPFLHPPHDGGFWQAI